MSATWFYLQEGQQKGPATEAEVRRLIASGDIASTTPVWREGMPAWTPLCEVHELGRAAFESRPKSLRPTRRLRRPKHARGFDPDGSPVEVTPNQCAPVSRRALAMALDIFIVSFVTLLLWAVLGALTERLAQRQFEAPAHLWAQLQIVLLLIYCAALEGSELQGTIGKMVFGIIVVDRNGQRISFPHAIARNLAKAASHYSFGLGFALALVTRKKQTLHDLVARTYVVEM